jgi:hypothetical protein
MTADEMTGGSDRRRSRRRFLGQAAAGSAIVASGLGLPTSTAADDEVALSSRQRRMVLQVARAGARVPIDFPDFGEPGPAVERATLERLQAAEREVDADRLALVRAGAADLIDAGLLGVGQDRLVEGIARHGAEADLGQDRALVALVAIAIATISKHFDPNADSAAQLWVDGLRRAHEKGGRPRPVTRLEER